MCLFNVPVKITSEHKPIFLLYSYISVSGTNKSFFNGLVGSQAETSSLRNICKEKTEQILCPVENIYRLHPHMPSTTIHQHCIMIPQWEMLWNVNTLYIDMYGNLSKEIHCCREIETQYLSVKECLFSLTKRRKVSQTCLNVSVFLCVDVWGLLRWSDSSLLTSLFQLLSFEFAQKSSLIVVPVKVNIT